MQNLFKIITLTIVIISFNYSSAFALFINDEAPLFSLRDSNGVFFHLSTYVGNNNKGQVKGIVINFFSSFCKPCKSELPFLNSLAEEFEPKGIKIVIVGYKEDFDMLTKLLDSINVSKPIVLSDPYGKIGEKYCVYGLPMTVFIGSDGKVKDIIKGEVPNIGSVLKEKVSRLLK